MEYGLLSKLIDVLEKLLRDLDSIVTTGLDADGIRVDEPDDGMDVDFDEKSFLLDKGDMVGLLVDNMRTIQTFVQHTAHHEAVWCELLGATSDRRYTFSLKFHQMVLVFT